MIDVSGIVLFSPRLRTRLDLAIAASGHDVSRREARRLLDARRVLVNGKPVATASRTVMPRDLIVAARVEVDIPILRREADWFAIDKPSGIPTQPPRQRDAVSCADLAVLTLQSEVFVVHRLDAGTTGVLLFATTSAAAARLSRFFASGEVAKEYLALAAGRIDAPMSLDAPIARESPDRFEQSAEGRTALTRVDPVASTDAASPVRVTIVSGRTHQIRVHLSAAGHPVIGDRKYGAGVGAPRPMLHARRLSHSSLGTIEAPIPSDFIDAATRAGIDVTGALE